MLMAVRCTVKIYIKEKKMPLYYVETGNGCCLRSAKTEWEAEEEVLREVGTRTGVSLIREATKNDIAWVNGVCVVSFLKTDSKNRRK